MAARDPRQPRSRVNHMPCGKDRAPASFLRRQAGDRDNVKCRERAAVPRKALILRRQPSRSDAVRRAPFAVLGNPQKILPPPNNRHDPSLSTSVGPDPPPPPPPP